MQCGLPQSTLYPPAQAEATDQAEGRADDELHGHSLRRLLIGRSRGTSGRPEAGTLLGYVAQAFEPAVEASSRRIAHPANEAFVLFHRCDAGRRAVSEHQDI